MASSTTSLSVRACARWTMNRSSISSWLKGPIGVGGRSCAEFDVLIGLRADGGGAFFLLPGLVGHFDIPLLLPETDPHGVGEARRG